MDTFLNFTIFIFGLIIGSFLNCVIYRLTPRQYNGGGLLRGRSFCPHCKHVLSWLDLIPVLSFLFLRGKCRYCQKPISLQYPVVEIATGAVFLLIILAVSNIYTYAYLLLMSCFLIVIFVYDLKYYIIPDKIIYPAIAAALIYNLLMSDIPRMSDILMSAFGAAAFFLAIVLVSRGKWMGVGDIKLAFFMGLLLGWPNILTALFLAFFIGAIMGLGLILSGKKTLKSEVPFGPFLVAGTFLAMFWGSEIVNWYLNLFLLQ